MAAGDVILFDQALKDLGDEDHNLGSDTIKLALTDGTTTPAADTADPRWGAGGTTDFSAEEVTPGGNYSAGGETLTATWTLTSGAAKFDADNVSIAQDAANPTNARWAVAYNDTNAGKSCLFAVDLGAAIDMSANALAINWAATGIFRLNQTSTSADVVTHLGVTVTNSGEDVTHTV
jgi:hypothetical protein